VLVKARRAGSRRLVALAPVTHGDPLASAPQSPSQTQPRRGSECLLLRFVRVAAASRMVG
jgi:hypothetical protein